MLIRRRQRVVLRSKARSQRRKIVLVVAVLALLCGLGARLVSELVKGGKSPLRLLPSPRVRAVQVSGIEDPRKSQVAGAFADLAGRKLSAVDAAGLRERLRGLDPELRLEGVDRNWPLRSVTLRVAARRPVAVCADSRRGGTLLDETGETYEAAAPVERLPRAESACASAREPGARKALAAFLVDWVEGGPGSLELDTVTAADGGWDLALTDGTRVRWGAATETGAKLAQLKAVLEDGKRRFRGVLSADLRFFDQGKVLVTPVGGPR